MQSHQGRRLKSKITLQNSDDEFSFEDRSQEGASVNWSDKFAGLYQARDRFVSFVESLGPLVRREIREDILAHCEQGSKKERSYDSYMSDDTILRTINLRIDKYRPPPRRMLKNKRIKKNWSEEDVLILIWVLSKYFDKMGYRDLEKDMVSPPPTQDHQDWLFVASVIPGVTPESCMFKWLSLRKVNLATNNWSEEESQLLATLVNESGNKTTKRDTKDWKAISQRLYFLCNRDDKIYRNAKQCREHWNCYLNPNLKKGPWRPQEDIQLLKCIRQNKGCKKWSQIVRYFDGRTENALKNRYTLIIEKQKKHYKHRSELEIIEEYLEKCYVDQFTNEMQHSPEQPESEPLYATPDKPHTHVKIEDEARDYACKQEPTTVTPFKVEKIDFKNMVSFDRIQLKFIQPGTLNNGIFEKSYNDLDSTEITTPQKLQLKRYHSSLL